MSSTALLPALAQKVNEWFPELMGRSLAVTEADITKENVPSLPLAMVSLLRERGTSGAAANILDIEEEVAVIFWFKPERYTKEDGAESPFWAYYDYHALRNRLMRQLRTWKTPQGQRMAYIQMDVEATRFAVMVTFRLSQSYRFCYEDEEEDPCKPEIHRDGQPIRITSSTCLPKSFYCKEEPGPCPESTSEPSPAG